jgi:hypothetical protein
MQAVFCSEDRKGTIADELKYIPAMFMNCRDDYIRKIVQQGNYLLWSCICDARETSQIAKPHDSINLLSNARTIRPLRTR